MHFCMQSLLNTRSGAEASSFFGDMFIHQGYSYDLDKLFGDEPEFDLDGQISREASKAEVVHVHTEACLKGDCQSSTQADEQAEDALSDAGSRLEAGPALSTTSLKADTLRKRPPAQVPSKLFVAEPKPQVQDDFEQEQARRADLVRLVAKIIDHEPLPQAAVLALDSPSLVLLSNFSHLIYKTSLDLDSAKLADSVAALNKVIEATPEKKRNEERIKYVFKRVNKILLKKFMAEHGLSEDEEATSMRSLINVYFYSGQTVEAVDSLAGYERLFTLLFKPSNMYRNDLKEVFGYAAYAAAFRSILDADFMNEYQVKRIGKIETYLRKLQGEIFYSQDQKDTSILQHKLSRLPWSISEVQKGVTVLRTVLPH